ncbi:MAG: single-stranded DNA-binding protein [Clostridia bacterium]|nr:single-stranded DNA-binding protein [Clostridia bacterium]
MASFNKAILIGNLTADPELRQTSNSISVCRFTIAVNRRFSKNADQSQQTADFINVVAWRERAEFVTRYFKKGRPILVCGQIQSRSWTDPQGGKHYATEVVADELSFVENKADGSAPGAPASGSASGDAYGTPAYSNGGASGFEEIPNDESLPF